MGMYDDDMYLDRIDQEEDDWEEDSVCMTGCECIHTTEKGILIRTATSKGYREAWFPKSYSQYTEGTDLKPNTFIYADWLTPEWSHMIG